MNRKRLLVLALVLVAAIVGFLAGGLRAWAQPRALLGGSYVVSATIGVNGGTSNVLLLATFTSDGKVLASDETLFTFDQAAAAACGFVDPAGGTDTASVRFGPSHGAWSFTPRGALWTTYALGDVNGRRLLRRARGIGQEFFASHGGPVVIDFFDAADRQLASPLCTFKGRWAATRIEPLAADFGDQ